jgi:hypothetical protein
MHEVIGRQGRVEAGVIALLAASALVLQFVLLLEANRGTLGAGMSTLRFFSYFTILSNVLVGLVALTAAIGPATGRDRFLARPGARAGAALCIAVTGVVYLAILRPLWQPQGAQWWADVVLHYAVPACYLGWWLFATPHGALRWRQLPRWLLFPLAYLAWIMFRQRVIETWAPYPFLDLVAHRQGEILGNIGAVMLVFLLLGALLLSLDRWLGRLA